MNTHCKQIIPLALIILLSFAAGTRAAEQVQFTRKYAVGDKFTFTQSTVADSAISMTMNGQAQKMDQKTTTSRLVTTTIEAVDADGMPNKTTFVFDKSSGGEMNMNGQSQAIPTSLSGKTITVTRTGEKELNYSAEVDLAAANEVKQMFTQEPNLLPTKPIGVGETWDIDPKKFEAMMPPGAKLDTKAKGKLLSVETTAGRQVATVEFSIEMSGGAQGMTMKSEMQGKGTIDVGTGLALDMQISGPMKGSGRQQGPQGVADFSMDGKTTITVKNKRESGGNAPAVGGPGPAIGGAPAGNIPGGNPLAQGPDFAGTFSNEKLTIKLISGIAGWTGTIKTGDKEYPISAAAITGSKITGKFTVGTDAFDFDGALDGKTLTINTGGASYTLTRAASANPLGR